jgi:signal transduction histidine kinase/ActR/RegA family two-component response regulator
MRLLRLPGLAIVGSLLVLTYLLVQGATPDPVQHEATLNAMRMLATNDAALQRDVLRARGGFLRNYDPLVRSLDGLREFSASLRNASELADADARADIVRKVEMLITAVHDQETLVEDFKSRNALLLNSLNFFSHLIRDASTASDARPRDAAPEIAALGSAMLRFTRDASPDRAGEVALALDQLDRTLPDWRPERRHDGAALVSHGRLIVAMLPAVDDLVARLQTGRTTERVQAVQDAYLDAYGRAAARAGFFRVLVFGAAVGLVAYIGYLFLRLGSRTRTLAGRLQFERLIAAISTQFINLPRDRIHESIDEGLARLAGHAGADQAYISVSVADENSTEHSYSWIRQDMAVPKDRPEDMGLTAACWCLKTSEPHDYVHVPRVAALPEGPEKACLQAAGIRSWLSIPIAHSDRLIGFGLATTVTEKQWSPDDIALLRTAAEIFANAIARVSHETEREMLETRLRKAQRLEAIGTLAGGIAHEFNNILGAILGYGEMALLALRRHSIAHRHIEQIMKAGERAQGVIDQVLAFSRQPARHYRPMHAQPVVAEAIDFIQASLPATIVVKAHLEAEGVAMLGDPTELQQVVMNLCTNAAQAMDGRGQLAIELSRVDVTGELVLSHGNLPLGSYLRLSVRDTGHGIEPAILERIFEPFFTTKAVGSGSGLGLSTVHGIVTQQGGALDVESAPGRGATFTAYFPQTEEPVVEERQPSEETVPYGQGETILLVDDERPLVLLGEEMLAAIGYEPVGFDKSPAALAAFRADPDRFDLVVTDEVMPVMSGTEFAVALHEIRPELPIILVTGYAGHIKSHQLQAAGIREVLRKPLRSASLSFCLARQLPRPGGLSVSKDVS